MCKTSQRTCVVVMKRYCMSLHNVIPDRKLKACRQGGKCAQQWENVEIVAYRYTIADATFKVSLCRNFFDKFHYSVCQSLITVEKTHV